MFFNVHTPCENCPFRKTKRLIVTKERAKEIVEQVIHEGKTFTCHKTLRKKMTTHCAGAIELIKKENQPHFSLAMARSLGIYKEENYNSPELVYDSAEEFINAQ